MVKFPSGDNLLMLLVPSFLIISDYLVTTIPKNRKRPHVIWKKKDELIQRFQTPRSGRD